MNNPRGHSRMSVPSSSGLIQRKRQRFAALLQGWRVVCRGPKRTVTGSSREGQKSVRAISKLSIIGGVIILINAQFIAMSTPQSPVKNESAVPPKISTQRDLLKLQSPNLYSSLGEMVLSGKPTSSRATFGKAERKDSKKVLQPARMAERDNFGRETKGPGAYLPTQQKLQNGEVAQIKDPSENFKYNSIPSYSIGRSTRKGSNPHYNYMDNRDDHLQVAQADLRRRNSMPSVRISNEKRFPSEREDKITPGPTYDPIVKAQMAAAPAYTLGTRRAVKGQDPLIPSGSTTNLVGPSSYFQKSRAQSLSNLNRMPYNSTTAKPPAISFAKGPKSLSTYRNSVDQTYDIKHKTILAHYDFEYDAGKGLNSGRAWMKKNIIGSCAQPLEKNKMVSYTISRASREKEQKRGVFAATMVNAPVSIRIPHPVF